MIEASPGESLLWQNTFMIPVLLENKEWYFNMSLTETGSGYGAETFICKIINNELFYKFEVAINSSTNNYIKNVYGIF